MAPANEDNAAVAAAPLNPRLMEPEARKHPHSSVQALLVRHWSRLLKRGGSVEHAKHRLDATHAPGVQRLVE